MAQHIQFQDEQHSNDYRELIAHAEPRSLRTFTPTQAVFQQSAGCFHRTPEGRRLYDFASGVLVTNLGHNPIEWLQNFTRYMGWDLQHLADANHAGNGQRYYTEAVTLSSYNAITEIEAQATDRLLASLQASPGGNRMQQIMWAASGSEAIQKALWASLKRDPERDLIVATRYGFHGKKGLANAVTGSEQDPDRDPRVKFISFPMQECDDINKQDQPLDLARYRQELDELWNEFGSQLTCLITEPYLGGGGSYHPQPEYHHLLQRWCREHDIIYILDEVQANFGRTGPMYAFEKYGIEPDIVCLGKGLGNGVAVAAAAGRADIFDTLNYGAASDTYSGNPMACAAVLATLDGFADGHVLAHAAEISDKIAAGLERLKETDLIEKVRGEGMVFGIECADYGNLPAGDVANAIVKVAYLGQSGGDGIHLLGPLSGKVIRISPPLTITHQEADHSLELLHELISQLQAELAADAVPALEQAR